MPKILFIESAGAEHEVEVKSGLSAMEGAVRSNLPGILAECGGACACATCHVFVHPAWQQAVGEPSDMEQSMLEFAEGATPASRLSCQIKMRDALDGLILHLPEPQ